VKPDEVFVLVLMIVCIVVVVAMSRHSKKQVPRSLPADDAPPAPALESATAGSEARQKKRRR
jgi:hypothetical protein